MPEIVIRPNHRRRLRRIDEPGTARALTFSCFQRRPFLASERTRIWLVDAIARARGAHAFHLWAFAILPEHAHILLLPNGERPQVGPILSTIKGSVAKRALRWVQAHAPAFLSRMADTAPNGDVTHRFWQRGAGYDRNLWSPSHIWQTIDYIHANPVRRGLCVNTIDWAWSSAAAHRDRNAGLLAPDLESLPPRPAHRTPSRAHTLPATGVLGTA